MDKLSGLVSNEFEREISPVAGRDSDSLDADFSSVFADVASKNDQKRPRDRQYKTAEEGNALPKKTEQDANKRARSVDDERDSSGSEVTNTEKSADEESKSAKKEDEKNDQRENLEMVSLGTSINIITSDLDSIDEESLADYAKREGIDLGLIQRMLKNRNSGEKRIFAGQNDQDVELKLSKNDEKNIAAMVEKRKQQSGELNNIKQGLSVTSLKGAASLASDKQLMKDVNEIKNISGIKMDQQTNPLGAVVSIKLKSESRDTLVRVKEGETTGKVISMDPIRLDTKAVLGVIANKLGINASQERKIVSLDIGFEGKGEEGIAQTNLTGSGKTEANIPSASELLRSDPDFRKTEQFQLLSQKMADAVGQRLTAQIAKGVWQVQIALKPEQLGRVDIQLGVNGGEIEAVFKSANILTRELIVEGFPRLKDVLEQSGMEVANLLLDGKGHKGNDGKPSQESSSKGDTEDLIGSLAENENKDLQVSTVSDDNVDVLV